MSKPSQDPTRSKLLTVLVGSATLLVGCTLNNLVLEQIVSVKRNPYATPAGGALLTMLQFVFTALYLLPSALLQWPAGAILPTLRPSKAPVLSYLVHSAMFLPMSILNNLAFAFRVSQPLHVVFRSAGSVVAVVMGVLFFGKRYSIRQYLAVGVLTIGAGLAASAKPVGDFLQEHVGCCGGSLVALSAPVEQALGDTNATAVALCSRATEATMAGVNAIVPEGPVHYAVGVGMLVAVMLLNAFLTLKQSADAQQYGREPNTAAFYTHLFALCILLPLGGQFPGVDATLEAWGGSPAVAAAAPQLSGLGPWLSGAVAAAPALVGEVPVMWVLGVLNAATQVVCISGVYMLLSTGDALAVTLVLTFRKVVSLAASVVIFGNPFGAVHVVAACLVFSGVLLYSDLGSILDRMLGSAPSKAETPGEGQEGAEASAGDSKKRR